MGKAEPTFLVDKTGLAKLLARRGKEFAVTELIQNAWDENTTRVDVALKPSATAGTYELAVEDDNPEGFADLAHAYTLFAESAKKDDPTKRGRFNLGEKLVIAMCQRAEIATTTGTIRFEEDGRHMDAAKRHVGSRFLGYLTLTLAEVGAVAEAVHALIPPAGILTTYNGGEVVRRKPLTSFEVSLRTERADEEGHLRPTRRKTTVGVFEPRDGETACLYEMGIPVVETGDTFHVDVGQKVPLNTDRDNVPPGFLRDVRAVVLNHTAHLLTEETASAKWIDDALADETVDAEAVKQAVTARYGKQVVLKDPSDREAEKIAVTQGYSVVGGGAFSKEAWQNIKAAAAIQPAGVVTPSPNPHEGEENLDLMQPDHWPEVVAMVVEYAREFAREVLTAEVTVRVANAPMWPYRATYGPMGLSGGQLTLNYGSLGYRWFERGPTDEEVNRLLIHEFAHHWVADHLSHEYQEACCRVGARLTRAVAEGRIGAWEGAVA